MTSASLQKFEHAIQDAIELLNHFDKLNEEPPPPPEAEVLKRASLVMALAALETYVEDRVTEAANGIAGPDSEKSWLGNFYISSLENDLKYFHTPTSDRVKTIFDKYLGLDVTEAWTWNNYDSARARSELNKITKKRGDIAHRSLRPIVGQTNSHAVTRNGLKKHIRFIRDLVATTDAFIHKKLK